MNRATVVIKTDNTGYSINQVKRTMIVGELIQELYEFDLMSHVMLEFDDGYTYGPVLSNNMREEFPTD